MKSITLNSTLYLAEDLSDFIGQATQGGIPRLVCESIWMLLASSEADSCTVQFIAQPYTFIFQTP